MIKVTFYPDVDKNELDSGLCNEISWNTIHPHLKDIFGVLPGERLVGITVTEYGIKAKFENEPKNK
jgi:hypothetical protein